MSRKKCLQNGFEKLQKVSIVVPTVEAASMLVDKLLHVCANNMVQLKIANGVYYVCYDWDEVNNKEANPVLIQSEHGRLDFTQYWLVITTEDGPILRRVWVSNDFLGHIDSELADRIAGQVVHNYVGEAALESASLIPASEVNPSPVKITCMGEIV
jgi:hypothetical protein